MALMSLSEISPEQQRRLDELAALEQCRTAREPIMPKHRRRMLISGIVPNLSGEKQPLEEIRRIHKMWANEVHGAQIATSIGIRYDHLTKVVRAMRAAGIEMSARRP